MAWSLDILFSYVQSLFSLLFGFKDSNDMTPGSEVLSSGMSSLLISSSKAFYIFVTVLLLCLISSVTFWFFLRISVALLTLSIYGYMMSVLPMRALSILIMIV